MKRFGMLAVLLSLGLFSVGCTDPAKKVEDKKADLRDAQKEGAKEVDDAAKEGAREVEDQKKEAAEDIEKQKRDLEDAQKEKADADADKAAPANP